MTFSELEVGQKYKFVNPDDHNDYGVGVVIEKSDRNYHFKWLKNTMGYDMGYDTISEFSEDGWYIQNLTVYDPIDLMIQSVDN